MIVYTYKITSHEQEYAPPVPEPFFQKYLSGGLKLSGPVTGILVLEKMVLGPKFPLEKLVPQTIFSGKIGPTLKILVRPSSSSRVGLTLKICLYI